MSQPRPSRRALLGASAWAAPVIVIASAAPAIAGSTNNITASFSLAKLTRPDAVVVTETGTIVNTTGAVRSVTLEISMTADVGTGNFNTLNTQFSNGWSQGTTTTTTTGAARTFTKGIPTGSSALPAFRVIFQPATATGAVFVRITPPTDVAAVNPAGQRF